MNISQLAHGSEIVWRGTDDVLELGGGFIGPSQFEQSPAERHPRREVSRMVRQPRGRDIYRLFVLAHAAMFFRELSKGDGRRVLLDPASQVFDATVVRHSAYGTATGLVDVLTRPKLSVSLNLT
jgi:hypothetical protein